MLGIAALPAHRAAAVPGPTARDGPLVHARWAAATRPSDHWRSTDPDADIDAELDDMQAAHRRGVRRDHRRDAAQAPYLRATLFVVGLGFFIQITGINATVTYGPKIFTAMGIESDQRSAAG